MLHVGLLLDLGIELAAGDQCRPVIEDAGKRTVYDTGDHRISGISQAQSGDATISFTGQNGLVRVSELKRIDE